MTGNQLKDIDKLEDSLWEAADQLRANSRLTSSEYCMPVLGVIFLRHATNRYAAACRQIAADQGAGKMAKRPLIQADFLKRRALMLPKEARYDEILKRPKGSILGTALVEAMNAIERDFEPLLNQLPKDYDKFENTSSKMESHGYCGTRSDAAVVVLCFRGGCFARLVLRGALPAGGTFAFREPAVLGPFDRDPTADCFGRRDFGIFEAAVRAACRAAGSISMPKTSSRFSPVSVAEPSGEVETPVVTLSVASVRSSR